MPNRAGEIGLCVLIGHHDMQLPGLSFARMAAQPLGALVGALEEGPSLTTRAAEDDLGREDGADGSAPFMIAQASGQDGQRPRKTSPEEPCRRAGTCLGPCPCRPPGFAAPTTT
ncbi:hypothetical protein B0T17DRAFT_517059 [Bombardia bombarda]|uniref:Uncharacterized protein n=1 Tax=Bombardia bombarda TaxID=252184 RepID=A0AA40CFN6_9PEZI|nr:hypothetical protein B0T17DRAFT_517059 [Bombardia bombarda]